MAYMSLRLKPGLDVEQTPTYKQAGYDQIEFGRFKAGLFQKLGGWSKFYPNAVGGVPKALWAWQDLNAFDHLAIGTSTEVDVITDGVLITITPQQLTTNPAPSFSTVNGSTTVTIVDAGITNVTSDDAVEFLTPVSIGGIILSGIYSIATRVSAHSYTIEARTPATATAGPAGTVPVFDTTINTSTITVTLNDHGQVPGNTVVFPVATSVGGLSVIGKYIVISVVSANQFTISATTSATSTATATMNSGNARFRYYIAVGPGGAGLGYGLGGYGLGGYGLGGGAGPDQTGTPITATDWTLDNWGELLVGSPENGGLYFWGPSSGFVNMSVVVQAPLYNTGIFVSMAQQQIIAFGASIDARDTGGIGIYQDPLLIAFSDLSDFFTWEATSENQAGNLRIPTGSKIVGAGATKNRNLVWTDLDLYALTYVNQPAIYDPNLIGSGCGLIGKHAWGKFGDSVYWMGKFGFFAYSGSGVLPIPCDMWDAIFQDLDNSPDPNRPGHLISEKSVCGSNSDFTEIWFSFPTISGGKGYPDRIAKYNISEGTWDLVPLDRLAWIDRSVLGSPIAVNAAGIIYAHESGFDADTDPLLPRFRTSFFYIDEGQDVVTIDEFLPDFRFGTYAGSDTAQISVTLYAVDTPNQVPTPNGPYLITANSTFITLDPPIRARQVAVEVSSADTGSFWRIGLLRFRWAPAGRMGIR